MFMDCKRWHTVIRLMFQRDSSACCIDFREASTGSRKLARSSLERGLWMRSTGDLEREERLWLVFMDGRCIELGGLLDVGDEGERGIEVNMEVSNWTTGLLLVLP